MSVPTQPGLTACPSCGAAVRPGSDWCTLCFTDLRPVPPPVVSTPAPVRPPAPATDDASEVRTIPCRTCGAPMNPMVDICPSCGVSLFQGLASETRSTLVLPVLGDVMRFSRAARLVGAAVLSTTFAGIVVGFIALVAAIF